MASKSRTDPKGRILPTGIRYRAGRYQVRVTFQRQQLSIGSYDTLTIAKAALEQARGQIALGTFVTPDKRAQLIQATREQDQRDATTVTEFVAMWLDGLQDHGASDGTLKSYRSVMKCHVLPAVGNMRLVDVTRDLIDGIDRGLVTMSGARNNARIALSSMFNKAVEQGYLKESPVHLASVKRRKHRGIMSDHLATAGEIPLFAAGMPDRLKLAVFLAAWCGLRKGEVLGLQRGDITGMGGGPISDDRLAVLHVARQLNSKSAGGAKYTPPKYDSVRALTIPVELMPMVVEHLEQWVALAADAPVFPSAALSMRPCSHTSFDDAWSKSRGPVHPGFRFHDLRHTGLTVFRRAGGTEFDAMARGGHRDMEVAASYQETDLSRDAAITEVMGRMIQF